MGAFMINMYTSERTSSEEQTSGEARFAGKELIIDQLPAVFKENHADVFAMACPSIRMCMMQRFGVLLGH